MRDTLKLFTSQPLIEASEALLNKLGIKFTPLVKGVPFNNFFSQNNFNYQYVNEARAAVNTIWHIGYVDDRTFQDNVVGGGSQSLSIFACDIKPDANFPRGLAAALTRAFTRVNTRQVNFNYDMPVVVIMKQGTLLTLATCELTDRLDGNGMKVGKVTMLRNMDCNNLHAGHRQILERIAYDVQGCKSYDDLHEKWFKSFSIDILSDKFFKGYKAIYEDIIEYVTGKRMVKEGSKWIEHDNGKPCKPIMDEFKTFLDPEKAVRDYVKNLMGRLVFIQFLQKKGWMGVPAGDSWEGGDPEFLQNLFKNSDKKETFIDDVLEPLFNDLNTKRHGDLVSNRKDIKVPYLNGGLFELDESDDTAFPLPSSYMQQLLDFFASYNFTIDENAPDDVEIGVDPEMLGRIFENLLEDNKEKGAFYTPKEIVQYMCRESLIAYLTTRVMKKQGENHRPEKDIRDAVRKLLSEPENIVPKMTKEHLEDFGTYIREVRICDPAIGSGAFPMGLLNELVRCRTTINAWAIDSYGNMLVGNIAALKAEIIRNNIYGVDIEKGAIDIARLRFWLSIIVDEKTPEALPNFDYKFMQGNSLIPTFAGQYMNLSTKTQNHANVQKMIAVKKKIHQFKQRFYSASGEEKMKLNVLIKDHILQLISLQLGYEIESWKEAHRETLSLDFGGQSKITVKDVISQLPEDRRRIVELGKSLREQLADESMSIERRAQIDIQFFDWRMMFTEVFDVEDGGFDIVIGNPPYINVQLMTVEDKKLYKDLFECFFKRCDMFCLFLEMGLLKLSSSKGIVTLIIPSVVHSNMSYQRIRDILLNNKWLKEVRYTGGDVFNAPTVDTTILVCNKAGNESITLTNAVDFAHPNSYDVPSDYFTKFNNVISIGDGQGNELFDKLFNESFDTVGQHYSVFQGIVTGNNPAFIFENENEAIEKGVSLSLLHPLCHGRDLEKYKVRSRERRILYIDNEVDIEDYPKTKLWLMNFKDALEKRREAKRGVIQWFGLQWPRVKSELDIKEKIMLQRTRNESLKTRIVAALDDTSVYGMEGIYFIIPKKSNDSLRYLLGILNSKLINYLFATKFLNLAIKAEYLKQVRIPSISNKQLKEMEELVDEVSQLKLRDIDSSNEENRIDLLVYHLYGLTYDEVLIVDSETPISRDQYDTFNSGS